MKKQASFNQSIMSVGGVTALILLVPFVAMQFSEEVAWSPADFIMMGGLIFGTGVSYKLLTRSSGSVAYKAATGLALGSGLFMIWANLAVGLIGSGPNPGNLMYGGVVAVAITGTILARMRPEGMARAMYATAIAVGLLAVIALLSGMHEYPAASVPEIVGVNGLFGLLFVIAGLLFQYAAQPHEA